MGACWPIIVAVIPDMGQVNGFNIVNMHSLATTRIGLSIIRFEIVRCNRLHFHVDRMDHIKMSRVLFMYRRCYGVIVRHLTIT